MDCLYVNHPHTTAGAEYKPLQQAVTAQAGLTMPATLISNDAAVDFARAVTNPVVCKTLSSLVLGGHCQVDGAGVFGCLVSADAYDSGDHGA